MSFRQPTHIIITPAGHNSKLHKKKKKKTTIAPQPEGNELKSIKKRRERLESMIQSRKLPPLPAATSSGSSSKQGSSTSRKSTQMSLSPHWTEKERKKERQPTPTPTIGATKMNRASRSVDRLPEIGGREDFAGGGGGGGGGGGREVTEERLAEMRQEMSTEIKILMEQQMRKMQQLLEQQKARQERKRDKQAQRELSKMQREAERAAAARDGGESTAAAKQNSDEEVDSSPKEPPNEEEDKEEEDKEEEGKEEEEEEKDKQQTENEKEETNKTEEEERKQEEQKEEEEEEEEEDITEEIEEIVAGLGSGNQKRQLRCAERVRELLSQPCPPNRQLVEGGVLPLLVRCMDRGESPQLQEASAWVITNIASGRSEHTQAVVDAGAVGVLVGLVSTGSGDVREQAVWALGNIVGDGARCRDVVLKQGVIPPLVDLLHVNVSTSLRRQVCWVLTNLLRVRGARLTDQQRAQCAEAFLVLVASLHPEVQADALWGAAYLADLGPEGVDTVLEAGLVREVVQRLYSDEERVVAAALRATGSIAAGTNEQTEALLQAGAVPIYRDLLQHPSPGVAREAAWILSNVTAGTPAQIQIAMDVQVVPALIAAVEEEDAELRKEATWGLANLASGCTAEQATWLAGSGLVPCLARLLQGEDAGMLLVALDALNNLFKKSPERRRLTQGVESSGGLERLRALKQHKVAQVARMSNYLLTTYLWEGSQGE
ncbi:importin subunit alpha-3-like [Scylla paramamosain]|uniref:importin subunit alpha-3-like n=1 Tax=Scylla paramamosain TaxID=85552 RepID=UPI003083C2F8